MDKTTEKNIRNLNQSQYLIGTYFIDPKKMNESWF